jgi:hypothetical protein
MSDARSTDTRSEAWRTGGPTETIRANAYGTLQTWQQPLCQDTGQRDTRPHVTIGRRRPKDTGARFTTTGTGQELMKESHVTKDASCPGGAEEH